MRTNLAAMKWELYDGVEVSPMFDGGDFAEPCEPEDATHWTVFVHLKTGGREAVWDFPSRRLARIYAYDLVETYSSLATHGLIDCR